MRAIGFSVLAVAFVLGGCTSSGVEALAPDAMTTAGIQPPEAVGEGDGGPQTVAAVLALESVPVTKGRRLVPHGAVGDAGDSVTPEPMALAARPVQTAAVAAIARQTVHRARFSDAKPVTFGRVKPAHYEVHGVDVSRWQGDIDWARLRRQGANFAWIKATDGDDHMDPRFRRNWDGAAAAGLARGAYHFFYWCSPAESQANWFIRNVPKVKGALPPVIDVEWNHDSKTCKTKPPRARVLAKMQLFMDMLEAHYGQRPVIYTAPDFYEDNLQGAFTDYPFWLRSVAAHPSKVYPDRDFAFWQYSGTGLASGVDNHIDLNAFNGTAEGWKKWLGHSVR